MKCQVRPRREKYDRRTVRCFVVLSAADYPTKSADYILNDLYSSRFHAYLDHRLITPSTERIPPEGFGDQNYIHPAWITLAFERYMALGLGYFKLANKLGLRKKAVYLRSPFRTQRFTPFNGDIKCYAGDFWLTGDRTTAASLLEQDDQNNKIYTHFSKRPVPDEGINQTILCNRESLSICPDNKRYADWRGRTNHPRSLTVTDFPTLLVSEDHFARKFVFDPSALRELDVLVDAKVEIKVGR